MKTVNLDLNASKDYFVNESLKTLRTNVQFCGTDVKAIAVTSCQPNEGKSTISLELARSLAEVGKKVLFIDADMRKSVVVQKYADGMGIVGLSQYLSGQNTLEDVLYRTQTEGMDIIFAGQFPANPVELLSSSAFKALIDEQTKVYDYVLIDTPPLGVVIDCAVIANVCDSAIMVIASEKVSNRRAKAIKAQLDKSGVHILGVVLNRVKSGSLRYPRPYSATYSKSKKKYGEDASPIVAPTVVTEVKKDEPAEKPIEKATPVEKIVEPVEEIVEPAEAKIEEPVVPAETNDAAEPEKVAPVEENKTDAPAETATPDTSVGSEE